MQEAVVGIDPIAIWKIWSWPARSFVVYVLIASPILIAALARVIRHTRTASHRTQGDELCALDDYSRKLEAVSRQVMLTLLLSFLVTAHEIVGWLASLSHCRYLDCGGGPNIPLFAFMVGFASCSLVYAIYCFSASRVARQRMMYHRVLPPGAAALHS